MDESGGGLEEDHRLGWIVMKLTRSYRPVLYVWGLGLAALLTIGQYMFPDELPLLLGLLAEMLITIYLVLRFLGNSFMSISDGVLSIWNLFYSVTIPILEADVEGIELEIWKRRFLIILGTEKIPLMYTVENIQILRRVFNFHQRTDLSDRLMLLIRNDPLNFRKKRFLECGR